MIKKPPSARQTRSVLITALVVLCALAGYFGAYYANLNLDEGTITYYSPTPGNPSVFTASRTVPHYHVQQKASEVIFWPADKLDILVRQSRNDRNGYSDTRDEWWQ